MGLESYGYISLSDFTGLDICANIMIRVCTILECRGSIILNFYGYLRGVPLYS